jgi:hypothetical protein
MTILSRNVQCPCGSGKKYKHCCLDKVDWDAIERGSGDRFHHLSVRGRNMAFLDLISEILLLDSHRRLRSLDEYKRAFTTKAVRELNEGILRIWPKNIDINAALKPREPGVSALYVGDYAKDELLRGIVRHSTYAAKLLVCDPFIYPLSVRDEFNPILNPDQHRAQTLRNTNLWLTLSPWIQAGIVEVIRTPCDFDRRLKWESMKEQDEKFRASAELEEAAKISVEEMMQRHSAKWKLRDLLLSMPDAALIGRLEEIANDGGDVSKEDLFAYVRHLRASDPDFLEPFDLSGGHQLQMTTTGAGYNIARLTASITNSYLVTDLHVKWKEIELDRRGKTEETATWSPFAKALQETNFRYLDDVSLESALELRTEGRLDDLRAFMRRVWSQACDTQSFARMNAQLLAEELTSEVRKAEEEWKQIDRDLLKNAGGLGSSLALAVPMIGAGQGVFLASAVAIAGLPLIASTWQRRGFQDRFPAAFFLRLNGRKL